MSGVRSEAGRQHSQPPPWVVPLLVGAVGMPTFVAFWVGGRPELGALWAGVSIAFAVVLALGGRSDAIRSLRGSDDDERTLLLEYKASAAMGVALVAALVGLFLAAGIRGENGLVYGALLLLAEAAHLVALAVLNRRS